MKVLLIQPPHYYEGKSRAPEGVPLGLGYIAKVLLNSGYKIEVLDIWANQYSDEEVRHKIAELDYDICGISAISTQYAYIKWLTSELKKHKDAPIVIGNALATYSPEIVLKNTNADICCIGEGEITFKEIVENINNLEKVKGIYFKKNKNEIIKNPLRKYIKDLDTIDFPAWDLFPMEIYFKHCMVWGTYIPAINIITARGCPYSCKFCSKSFSGVRVRSINNIIEEIKLLKEKFGIGGVVFHDELVLINKQRALELCDKIKPLKIKWNCQGRANLVDIDILKRMKSAGCVAVGYGIESGSQTILNNMNKRTTVEQNIVSIKNTMKVGLKPIIQMMYGYPGENRITLQETIDFSNKIPFVGRIHLSITTPLPGSELFDQALKSSLIKDEEKYLTELASGYCSDRLLINFTDFSEKEFFYLRLDTAKKMYNEQIKTHPEQYLMKVIKIEFNNLCDIPTYVKKFGYKQLIKKVIEKINNTL